MQLAATSRAIDMPAPTSRPEAAKQLLAVPMGVITVATMTAMTKQMGGEAASRADLVSPFLAKVSAETAQQAMLAAVEGALALAPELAPKADALRQAAAGVAALLADAGSDATKGDAKQTLERLTVPMQQLAAPLFEAAVFLDPSLQKPA